MQKKKYRNDEMVRHFLENIFYQYLIYSISPLNVMLEKFCHIKIIQYDQTRSDWDTIFLTIVKPNCYNIILIFLIFNEFFKIYVCLKFM